MNLRHEMPQKIGVGIVGASSARGWANAAHIPAIQALDAFEIRGVSTTREETAWATASRLGIDLAFDNHQDLVARSEIDLVVVCVKVPHHHGVVADSIAAGKMIYCEWPLARNLVEAEELERSAREKSLKTMVGLQGRMAPPVGYLRDLIRQDAIGRPLSTSIRAHPSEGMWVGRFDPPFEFMAQSANGATMLSIAVGHALEPLAQVLGEFETLSAIMANQRGDGIRLRDGQALHKDAPDEIAVVGTLETGIVASLHYSAGMPAGPSMVWEIQGNDGSLLIESVSGDYLHADDLTITLRRGRKQPERLAIPAAYMNNIKGIGGAAAGVGRLYAQFAADLTAGTSNVPDFGTALARHRTLDAILQAAATGKSQGLVVSV